MEYNCPYLYTFYGQDRLHKQCSSQIHKNKAITRQLAFCLNTPELYTYHIQSHYVGSRSIATGLWCVDPSRSKLTLLWLWVRDNHRRGKVITILFDHGCTACNCWFLFMVYVLLGQPHSAFGAGLIILQSIFVHFLLPFGFLSVLPFENEFKHVGFRLVFHGSVLDHVQQFGLIKTSIHNASYKLPICKKHFPYSREEKVQIRLGQILGRCKEKKGRKKGRLQTSKTP